MHVAENVFQNSFRRGIWVLLLSLFCIPGDIAAQIGSSSFQWKAGSQPSPGISFTAFQSTVDGDQIVIGTKGLLQGFCTVKFMLPTPLNNASIHLSSLYLTNAPAAFNITVEADGQREVLALPAAWRKGYVFMNQGLDVAVPATFRGVRSFSVTINAREETGQEYAAQLNGLSISGTLSSNVAARGATVSASGFALRKVNPWMAQTADKALSATNNTPLVKLTADGLINDWITTSFLIQATGEENVDLSWSVPAPLNGKVQVRVAGQVYNQAKQVVWDPLFDERQISNYWQQVINGYYISAFPHLVVTDKYPSLIWITVNTTGVSPGSYTLNITAKGRSKTQQLPVVIQVGKGKLPDASLDIFGWQHNSGVEDIKDMLAHGINVFWADNNLAWNNGAHFLLYTLPTFDRPSLDEKKKTEIRNAVSRARDEVKRLKVPANRWAFYIADETTDKTADKDVAVADYIHGLDKSLPVYYNPAFILSGGRQETSYAGTFSKIRSSASVVQPYIDFMADKQATGIYESSNIQKWFYVIPLLHDPGVGIGIIRKGSVYAFMNGATGWGLYALNAWANYPWDHSISNNYSLIYPDRVSSRGYEALRQGLMEYKRLTALSAKGYPAAQISRFAGDLYNASSAEAMDGIRQKMDAAINDSKN